MKPLYIHPQEIWDEKKCEKIAKYKGSYGYGIRHPYPGLVASNSSANPQYGQTQRYNGGCIRQGEHYESERVPLPKIPDSYEFYAISAWGTHLRKKV